MIFNAYAAYYNLLYADKDYAAEAKYIHDLIQQHHPSARSIIDFGSGTGKHALELAEMGYEVMGVDLSENMVALANENCQHEQLQFHIGDIRSVRLQTKFDVAVSLFHVISYQATDDCLQQSFETAAAHLQKDGLFIFDCWYGPGVVADPPTIVHKTMRNDWINVERVAYPTHDEQKHTVNVHFDVTVTDSTSGEAEQINEDHLMRYLYKEEVLSLAEKTGFSIAAEYPWMQTSELGNKKCWNAVFVLRKN